MRLRQVCTVVLFCGGCTSQYGFGGLEEVHSKGVADIEVVPAELDFGGQVFRSETVAQVVISNVGFEPLVVEGLYLDGSVSFALVEDQEDFELQPGDSVPVSFVFTALAENDSTLLRVTSTDPRDPVLEVPMKGSALQPGLEVEPDPVEYGGVQRPCVEWANLTLRNTGAGPVSVEGFELTGHEFVMGELDDLPWPIEGGEETKVRVGYQPDDGTGRGILRVLSDDPAGPISVDLVGEQEPGTYRIENFRQLENSWPAVDIVFTIDRSGSMSDDTARLAANYDVLEELLSESELDYHVIVVTRDSGCHNLAIIDKDVPGSHVLFGDACTEPGGIYTEAGLTLLEGALENSDRGECNWGWLRDDANHLAVLLSDEPEQSPGGSGGVLDDILLLDPSMVINVVVGQAGSRCAELGRGYHEAADTTGGANLDLCDADWVDYFRTILETSINEAEDTFELFGEPVPETLVVEVNDTPSTRWEYDDELNAIVFEEGGIPEPDAEIVVTYQEAGDCPE